MFELHFILEYLIYHFHHSLYMYVYCVYVRIRTYYQNDYRHSKMTIDGSVPMISPH